MHIDSRSSHSLLTAQAVPAKAGGNSAAVARFTMDITVTGAATMNEPAPPSVGDIKKEFYDYLDSLPLAPGLSRTALSVNITDAAFEKMLVNPEYKQKMKDLCARDLCDPAWTKSPPAGSNIVIDADCKEEYLASSWGSAHGIEGANSDGFWTRRTKKRAEQKGQEEKALEKREMMEFLQECADERKRLANGLPGSGFSGGGSGAYTSLFGSLFGK